MTEMPGAQSLPALHFTPELLLAAQGVRGLLELEQQVGGLDLDPLARVELDLHRSLGLGHHTAGEELAGVIEQCIAHGAGLSPTARMASSTLRGGGRGCSRLPRNA